MVAIGAAVAWPPPEVPEGAPPAVRVEGLSVEYRRRGASHRALDDARMTAQIWLKLAGG